MIPGDWELHRRSDGELIGYLAPVEGTDTFVPTTLIGTPVGEATDWCSAGVVLDELGLSYLAERWVLTEDDGSERQVVLVEADPMHVVVAHADFAQVVGAQDIGVRTELSVPTDRLRRA